MPTKLKNLKIKRVAFVDEGANPDAHIRFAKNKDGEPPVVSHPDEQSVIKRMLAAIAKAFGAETVEKAAFTFAESEEQRDYERIMDAEIYPMCWAFIDSTRSILTDAAKGDAEKASLLKQSLAEFSAAFDDCADTWAKGQPADATIQKDTEVLAKMRDHLNELLTDGDPEAPESPENVPPTTDTADRPEPPANEKGESNMIFDVSKMTPEEKAVYEDLAKRFGSEEPPVAPAAPTQEPDPAPDADGGDVYKGLHPAVREELENLRKFREESETRQYVEVAKKYALLGKKPEELGAVLKSLKDAGGSAYDDMISVLDSNLAMVEKSGVFGEIGKRGTASTAADDAWGKIEAVAQEIVKAKPDIRWTDAIDEACMKHPELVQEYEKSR